MARKRVEDERLIKSWEDADNVLKTIAHHELALEEIKGEMNKEINEIKDKANTKSVLHKDEIKNLEKELKVFVELNKATLDGKTKELNFGSTGFRKSTSVVLPRAKEKLVAIMDSLRKNKMGDCIDVKESINKDSLKRYSEEMVLKVGAKLKISDTFWYDVKYEEVK